MPAEGMQPMRIRSGDQWFAKPGCDSSCPAIRIERANVKMTELNRVKTIDSRHKPRSDRAAKNVERVRRDSINRIAAARPKSPQIIEIFYLRDFFRVHIQHDHIRAEQTH